jgi:hypothetical protein
VVGAEIGSRIQPGLCAPSERDASAARIKRFTSAGGIRPQEGIVGPEIELRLLTPARLRQKKKKRQAKPPPASDDSDDGDNFSAIDHLLMPPKLDSRFTRRIFFISRI